MRNDNKQPLRLFVLFMQALEVANAEIEEWNVVVKDWVFCGRVVRLMKELPYNTSLDNDENSIANLSDKFSGGFAQEVLAALKRQGADVDTLYRLVRDENICKRIVGFVKRNFRRPRFSHLDEEVTSLETNIF